MRDELRDAEDVRDENANYRQDDGTMAIEGLVGQGRYVVPFTMSREQEAVMMESSRAQLSQLMEECAAPIEEEPSSSWVRVKTKKKPTGVFLWEKRALKAKHELEQHFPREDQDPVVYSVRSSTTVNAPLDTVLKTLDASVATAHRSFTRIIYGSLVADSSVLFHSSAQASDYLDNRESDSFETLAVRWFVCHSSNPMTSDGDFCLQEYTKRHSIDELPMNGEYNNNNTVIGNRNNETNAIEGLHSVQEIPVAYKLFRSLETRHCPELQESHRLVRCKVPLGGILLYPTDSSDKTDVVFYMSIAQDKGANRGNWNGHVSPVHTQCSDRQFRALQQVRQTQHETQKQIQKYLNADAPNIGIEDEGAFENHIPKSKAGEIRSTLDKVRAKQHEQDRSLVHRTVQELKPYEDIFLKLCHDAAAVRHSKFVAFTLFTGAPQGDRNQPNKDDGEEVAAHYLKVKGSVKLIKVADNLRCCDPVLQLQKSVITRNTWEVIGNSALHPSGYEFRQLPVVLGPQQARFYAGVPLVSIKKQYCYGALAVFDAGISPGEDNDPAMTSALLSLEKLAREAVAAVDERRKELELRTFLQAPLLQMRQSEPTLHLKMDLTRRSQHWQDVSDLLSLDGDSDDDQIEEAQRRLEYELHHEKGKSGVAPNSVGKSSVGKPHKVFLTPKSSSVGKARVQYFQNKMQELVQRAQDTQAQMVENPITMERHGVSIV
ncbi:hypothetical protein PHYBOEH_006797 [Phytophthora boehmeriae]|uniref:GAF domain-containing protein n=1 Tax=Phytophthora boehmeriae TaxID=109152 RepID=A0A8T1WAM3_9STRA|nr:hypothetical protein PHYBOEH_006797 [Phytophthora boehmeriae]